MCATHHDGLVVVEVDGKLATCGVHIFGANPTWYKNLCIWLTAGVESVGNDLKAGDRVTTMTYIMTGMKVTVSKSETHLQKGLL